MDNEKLVTVLGIYKAGDGDGQYFVLLKSDSPKLRLPIFVGQNEAFMIACAKDGLPRERPLTFDLFANTLATTGFTVRKIFIWLGGEQLFYATITIEKDDTIREIDARPSDAIALALTANAPVFVSEKTLLECGRAD